MSIVDQLNRESLVNEFKAVVSDTEALVKATANTGGEKVAELRSKAEESLRIAKIKLADSQAEAIARAKAAVKAGDAYVHEHPWRTIGLATSIGVVIGLLIGRR